MQRSLKARYKKAAKPKIGDRSLDDDSVKPTAASNRQEKRLRALKRNAGRLKVATKVATGLGLPLDPEALLAETRNSREFVEVVFDLQTLTRRVAASSDKRMWRVLETAFDGFERFQQLSPEGKLKAFVGLRGKLSELKAPRVNANDEARMLLHIFVDYGNDRRRLNRDALALRFAHREGITPDAFYDRVSTPQTGGLDRWSREETKAKKANKPLKSIRHPAKPPVLSKVGDLDPPEVAIWTLALARQARLQVSRSGAVCIIADCHPNKKEMQVLGATRLGPCAKSDEERVAQYLEALKTVGRMEIE